MVTIPPPGPNPDRLRLNVEEAHIDQLARFFQLLDKWDRTPNRANTVKTTTQSHREAVEDGTKC
jgi:hypothetical protein